LLIINFGDSRMDEKTAKYLIGEEHWEEFLVWLKGRKTIDDLTVYNDNDVERFNFERSIDISDLENEYFI